MDGWLGDVSKNKNLWKNEIVIIGGGRVKKILKFSSFQMMKNKRRGGGVNCHISSLKCNSFDHITTQIMDISRDFLNILYLPWFKL